MYPGDPTRFGTLPPHPIVRESVRRALDSGKYEGYGNSAGLLEARAAVAEAFTCQEAPLTADVSVITLCVLVTSGRVCSMC